MRMLVHIGYFRIFNVSVYDNYILFVRDAGEG